MTHPGNQPANVDDRIFIARFTTASGYVALGLLALTLLISCQWGNMQDNVTQGCW